jgi:uncharacterized protein YjbI with pentapeptide repeats
MTSKRDEGSLNLRRFDLRRLNLRRPAALTALGVTTTIVLALAVVILLLVTGGAKAVSDNAALIAALVALGGVFTAQMTSIALENRRAHETALQNYFEQVGKLLIEQPLLEASPGDKLSTVVRAQTLTLLEELEPERKRILLQFLHEAALIDKDKPIVSLESADLTGANLTTSPMDHANLSGANLRGPTCIGP